VVTKLPLRDVVVVGTSAGGLGLLRQLVGALPAGFPASLFIVMHTSAEGPAILPEILAQRSALPVRFPQDGDPIEPGHVFVAPPDHHVLLDPGKIVVVRGPRENRFRPAIDPLFRSAAVHYGPRVIGIILSGMLDDGASGLHAVKQCGGVAVVQDPSEADYPEMIHSARRAVEPDYCVRVGAMPDLLAKLTNEPVTMDEQTPTPDVRLRIETDIAATRRTGAKETAAIGKLSRLVCPECSGALWEVQDEHVLRFRCHVGHAFSSESLAADQSDALERALFVALRTLDDSAALAARLAAEAETNQRAQSALMFRRRSEEAKGNAEIIRKILTREARLDDPARDRQRVRAGNGEDGATD
jgi:two-component system, chemotaxis family, protein-glutamate methylesterase/glutaminase